ncbi:hypothetical protein CHARACLAT_009453 [Characodon lateralis]|uniref:Uncharacterized protein n=1 Tax=Characodon lateralis TaxID=208331 RepID=A0ABU7CY84_9TELE|nr:hypothetical protein [Characodon lateralis]
MQVKCALCVFFIFLNPSSTTLNFALLMQTFNLFSALMSRFLFLLGYLLINSEQPLNQSEGPVNLGGLHHGRVIQSQQRPPFSPRHSHTLPTPPSGSSFPPLKVWIAADEDAEQMITFYGLLQRAGPIRAAPRLAPDLIRARTQTLRRSGTFSRFPTTFGICILPVE